MIEQARLFEEDPEEIKSDQQPKIMDLIPEGRENAASMRYLAMICQRDERSIREMVKTARISGSIICGDDAGYFLPTCEEELARWIHRAESSLISTARSLQPAKKALAEGRYPKEKAE